MRIDISPMIRHRYASQKDIPAGGPDTLAVPSPGGDMPEEPDQISSGLSESPPPPCPGSVVFASAGSSTQKMLSLISERTMLRPLPLLRRC